MEKLEKLLMTVKGPVLENSRKLAIKNHLLSQIKVPASNRTTLLSSTVRLVASSFVLSPDIRARIKERVFAMIEKHSQRKFFWSNFFAFQKSFVALVIIVAVVFGFLNFLNIDTTVVRAANFTALESFEGKVTIKRGDKLVTPKAGMQFYENDTIITNSNGSAVIRYFDDSITRLDGSTTLVITDLKQSGDSVVNSHVEVALVSGSVWSKVINLVGEGASFVVSAGNIHASARQAAFNMQVKGKEVEIGVFNHAVDVTAGSDAKKVLSGEKLVMEKETGGVRESGKIDQAERGLAWVQENLASDRQYLEEVEQKLLDAKVLALGQDPSAVLALDNSFSEQTLLFLTFDDIKKRQLELDLAEKKFVAAQIKLHDENLTDDDRATAKTAIEAFAAQVGSFADLAKKVAYTDETYGGQLNNYLKEKILIQKKDLSVVFPDSPVYDLRGVVDDLQLMTASDTTDLMEIKSEQALDKLAVAEELSSRGDYETASEVLDQYQEEITGLVEMIDTLETDNVGLQATTEEVVKEVAETADLAVTIAAEIEVGAVEVGAGSNETVGSAVVEAGVAVDEDPVSTEPEPVTEGPFGVTVQGDKPLPPLLQDVE